MVFKNVENCLRLIAEGKNILKGRYYGELLPRA